VCRWCVCRTAGTYRWQAAWWQAEAVPVKMQVVRAGGVCGVLRSRQEITESVLEKSLQVVPGMVDEPLCACGQAVVNGAGPV